MRKDAKRAAGWLLAVCLGLAGSVARGADEDSANWQAQCLIGGQPVILDFRSASGDAFEDDMVVQARPADASFVTLPLPPALYHAIGPLGSPKSACDSVPLLDMGGGLGLLLVVRDNRPGLPVVDALLLDQATLQVVDKRLGDPGAVAGLLKTSSLVLRQSADGVDLRLVREAVPGAECDCADGYAEDWLRFSVEQRKLRTDWRP
ncbi:hypothetical protein N7414_11385 [Pseudomonas sp. GD04087]|uniref:hypothetical protein n=1 Tax=unclassified Pseudomonas TaxID=196821 RepID=UPI00244A5EFE|nr:MULTISPECIES: hypothetical protein [unclassified Pseudomonas]MDH0289718.1 hypothetical protein [Pseudomonas sp. GD04087]MDH1048223.1 hypothetical protein [Pseudomonas sp. GD03903]MDH2002233.1 hypothetical protein [Pseudomonas sp. GD03691]